MVNHRNYVASLSQLGRWLADEAEGLGVTILPETSAEQLLVDGGRVVGVRTGDRGRGRSGEELGNFEPGSDIAARVTILAEGTQGHLTGAALERFGLRGENPQVWALGVKEVWKVAKPLGQVIHTMGWPLRPGEEVPRVRRVVRLPDGRRHGHDRHGRRPRLPRHRAVGARPAAGAEDASARCGGSSRAASVCSGARRRFPEGGFVALPARFHAPGLLLCGDGVGLVNVPALKGIHYAIESGRLAAEAAWRTLTRGASARAALASYDASLRESFIWRDLREVRNMRQAFGRGFYVGGALAGAMTASKGQLPAGRCADGAGCRAVVDQHRPRGVVSGCGREARVRQAVECVRVGQSDARRPAEPHSRPGRRCRASSRSCGRTCARRRCTRSAKPTATAPSTVKLAPSNCVQCGAITAKGGRLTPPEGGSGPEYTVT